MVTIDAPKYDLRPILQVHRLLMHPLLKFSLANRLSINPQMDRRSVDKTTLRRWCMWTETLNTYPLTQTTDDQSGTSFNVRSVGFTVGEG